MRLPWLHLAGSCGTCVGSRGEASVERRRQRPCASAPPLPAGQCRRTACHSAVDDFHPTGMRNTSKMSSAKNSRRLQAAKHFSALPFLSMCWVDGQTDGWPCVVTREQQGMLVIETVDPLPERTSVRLEFYQHQAGFASGAKRLECLRGAVAWMRRMPSSSARHRNANRFRIGIRVGIRALDETRTSRTLRSSRAISPGPS